MMRVRCDAGALNVEQLRTIAGISKEFGRNTADLSDRENVQFHWIEVENVPEIWKRLEAVGLKTTEACGDCPRVVLGSPLAGESLDEVLDPTPAIDEIVRRYIGDPKYSNLPRKFKTAISGQQDVVHEINDIAFIGVNHPEHGPGLDLWVGGGLSTNPMLAQRVAPGFRSTRSPMSGRVSSRSSVTTATAVCARRPGSSSSSRTGVSRSSARFSRPSTSSARSSTAPRPRSPSARSITSASRRPATATTQSVSLRSPAASRETSWLRSPTPRRRPAATGSASLRTRS